MTLKSTFSRTVLCTVLLVILLASANVSAQTYRNRRNNKSSVSSNQSYRGNLSSDEYEIFDLVNRERSRKGLGRLDWDGELAQLARSYSRQMAKQSFFGHYDRDGNSIVDRAQNSGINGWRLIGENLFFCEGYDDFNGLAVRGWMNSTEHRRNILERRYNASGIGIAQARNGQIYITQVFVQR